MTFLYLDKPIQLAYLDTLTGNLIDLPHWVRSADDLFHAEQSVRNRRWGNIPFTDFRLKVWDSYGVGTADGNTVLLVPLFAANGSTNSAIRNYRLT